MASAGAIVFGLILMVIGFLVFSSIGAAQYQASSSNPFGYAVSGLLPQTQVARQNLALFQLMGMGAMGIGAICFLVGLVSGGKKQQVVQQVFSSVNVKFCGGCGARVSGGSVFCSVCGRRF